MDNIFETAAKLKLRFETSQGFLTAEDLFDLSLQSLDICAKRVNNQLKTEETETFIPTTAVRKTATNNDLRLEILKRVITIKVEEQEARATRVANAARLAHLKELAAVKANEALASQDLDELNKQIAELEKTVAV